MQWQDMAAAPKDGREILILVAWPRVGPKPEAHVGYWDGKEWLVATFNTGLETADERWCIGWIPIPERQP